MIAEYDTNHQGAMHAHEIVDDNPFTDTQKKLCMRGVKSSMVIQRDYVGKPEVRLRSCISGAYLGSRRSAGSTRVQLVILWTKPPYGNPASASTARAPFLLWMRRWHKDYRDKADLYAGNNRSA